MVSVANLVLSVWKNLTILLIVVVMVLVIVIIIVRTITMV